MLINNEITILGKIKKNTHCINKVSSIFNIMEDCFLKKNTGDGRLAWLETELNKPEFLSFSLVFYMYTHVLTWKSPSNFQEFSRHTDLHY